MIAALCYRTTNIGDDIQSLITTKLFPINYLVDRDDYNIIYDYKTGNKIKKIPEKIYLIMNGWFMHNPSFIINDLKINFPYENNLIRPIFLSTNLSNPLLFSEKSLNYYKKFPPFYSRDKNTTDKLKKENIRCKTFGCLSQLFEKKHLELREIKKDTNNTICFVDVIGAKEIFKNKHSPKDQIIEINHETQEITNKNPLERLFLCEDLLKFYTTCKKIYTTRLHCFLPCRALGLDVEYLGQLDGRTEWLVRNKPDKNKMLSVVKNIKNRIINKEL